MHKNTTITKLTQIDKTDILFAFYGLFYPRAFPTKAPAPEPIPIGII